LGKKRLLGKFCLRSFSPIAQSTADTQQIVDIEKFHPNSFKNFILIALKFIQRDSFKYSDSFKTPIALKLFHPGSFKTEAR